MDYLPLIIGWFLGIISTIIVDYFKKIIQKKEMKKGLLTEIEELQLSLVAICFSTTLESQKVTEEWTNWIKSFFEKLIKSNTFDYMLGGKFDKNILQNLNEKDFYDMCQSLSNKDIYKIRSTLIFAKIATPYLSSKYDSMSLFSEIFQSYIMKLRKELDVLNHYFEVIWFYQTKTFENYNDTNNELIRLNIRQYIERISKRTQVAIKIINDIINL